MFLNNVRYMRVFNKENKEKYVQCNLSEGEKRQDGTWDNYSYNTRFVGKCLEQAKMLNDKDVITIVKGKITTKYSKEHGKEFTNVVVFEFEKQDSNTSGNDGFYPIETNEYSEDTGQYSDDLPFN